MNMMEPGNNDSSAVPLDLSSNGTTEDTLEDAKENSNTSSDAINNSPREETEKIKWSVALKSPSSAVFSPSKEVIMGTKEPQHGCALLALVERARTVTRLHRRATILLLEVAHAYDEFSQSLLIAGQSLKEVGNGASDVQQSLVFWSGSTSKLANSFRTEICAPLKSLLQAYVDSLNGIWETYIASRRTCLLVRQNTSRVETSYNKQQKSTPQPVPQQQKPGESCRNCSNHGPFF